MDIVPLVGLVILLINRLELAFNKLAIKGKAPTASLLSRARAARVKTQASSKMTLTAKLGMA